MTARQCSTPDEAIACADAYLTSVALPTYSDLLDLLRAMHENSADKIEEDDEIEGILYGAGR